jgi:hypothetical protein
VAKAACVTAHALLDQSPCHRQTDALACACNDGDFAGQMQTNIELLASGIPTQGLILLVLKVSIPPCSGSPAASGASAARGAGAESI